jgi:hemerythrin
MKVTKYGERHLQREELMLRLRGYPGYAEHRAEHDAYRNKVASFQLQYDRRDLGIRIANFLTEWWRSHILISDQQYGHFFQCKRTNS